MSPGPTARGTPVIAIAHDARREQPRDLVRHRRARTPRRRSPTISAERRVADGARPGCRRLAIVDASSIGK